MLPFTTVKVFCKAVCDKLVWPRQQESNLYFTLRRHTFYPLNYGEYIERGYGLMCYYGFIEAVIAVFKAACKLLKARVFAV